MTNTDSSKCVVCHKELFDGVYSGARFTKNGLSWTCGECAKPEDWYLKQ